MTAFWPTQPLASSKPPTIANGNHNLGYARQGCFTTLPTITQVRLPFAIVGGLELARGFAKNTHFSLFFRKMLLQKPYLELNFKWI